MARTRTGITLFVLALVATILVACGGGGGSSSALPPAGGSPTLAPATAAPTSSPSVTTQTVAAGAQPVAVALPTISTGVSFTATLPTTTSGAGTLVAQLSATNPSGVVPQLSRRTLRAAPLTDHALRGDAAADRLPAAIGTTNVNALGYVAFTPTATLTFGSVPALTFAVAPGTAAPNGFWIALYDPTNAAAGWTVVGGPATAAGTTVTFPARSGTLTLAGGVTTVIVFFAPGGTYPTPTPAPTVAPVPTPTGTNVACASDARRAPLAGPRRPALASHAAPVVPDEVYVSYPQGAGRSVESVARGVRTVSIRALGAENGVAHAVLRLAAGADRARAEATLRAGGASVYPLHERQVKSCTASANDQLFTTSDQWYLFRTSVASATGAADGWSLSHGRGITVAVIDTGADLTNGDLAPKIAFEESVVGGVTDTSAGAAQDTNGHGTNVAGLVAAATNNAYGFAAIGWEVGLQIYRIFPPATAQSDQQSADTADEAQAIRDAVARGAAIINLSLGSPSYGNAGFDQAEYDAVEYAISQGVTVVAAAGNEYADSPSTDGSVPDDPGAYPGVIAVGASAVQDAAPNQYASITSENAASYSNSGAALLAPGGDPPANDPGTDDLLWIEGYDTTTAALPADQCSGKGGVCRALFAGTSQATPQVSATIALMQALGGGPRSLTPARALTILGQSADQLSGVPAARQGAGRLNVLRALQNTP